jgi:hypothetical protein
MNVMTPRHSEVVEVFSYDSDDDQANALWLLLVSV